MSLALAVLGSAAVAGNGAALAQQAAGHWPVTTEGGVCMISQTFQHPDFGLNTLQVGYDPAAARVTLTATARLADTASLGDTPRLGVLFLNNGEEDYDPGWGLRAFSRGSSGGAGVLSTAFEGRRNVEQILQDLATSRALGLMRDGEVIVGFELHEAAQGIARLRECARRGAG